MAKLRAVRETKRAALVQAQEDLRALLTIRQEAPPFYTACWIRTVRRSGVADDGRRRSEVNRRHPAS